MTIQTSVTHLLRALMTRSNGRNNGNKWVVHIRAPIGNTLAVGHKCGNSLTIKARNSYKRKKWHNPKLHTKIHSKITPSQFLSKNFSFSDLIIRVFLTNTTLVYPISFQVLLQVSHWRRNQPNFIHLQRCGAQLLISCIIKVCDFYQYFASTFGIITKSPQRKSSSISPYFHGRNLVAFGVRCVVAHKTLFSPNFCNENMARSCHIFSVKIWQSFVLVRYSAPAGLHSYVYNMRQWATSVVLLWYLYLLY